jgi:hypothetical protein
MRDVDDARGLAVLAVAAETVRIASRSLQKRRYQTKLHAGSIIRITDEAAATLPSGALPHDLSLLTKR